MFDEGEALDEELGSAMDVIFDLIKENPENPFNDDQLKMAIVATNIKALANVLMIADEDPERITLNLKQLTLGLLGTADWLVRDLPQIESVMDLGELE